MSRLRRATNLFLHLTPTQKHLDLDLDPLIHHGRPLSTLSLFTLMSTLVHNQFDPFQRSEPPLI
jgi:hypothetical protein